MFLHPNCGRLNLSHLLREAADRYASKTALICQGRTVTYQELDRAAKGLGGWFLATGLQPGDRVAIHWNNAIETVELLLGCFHAGLIAVPINTRLKPAEISYLLGHCRPKLFFSQPELAAVAEEARGQVPGLPEVRTRPPEPVGGAVPELPSADAPALILYTSGTTARPKGVVHTQATLAATARTIGPAGSDDSAILMVAVPLMHGSGLVSLTLPALMAGATAVLLPTFDPGAMLDTIARHRCTWAMGLPAMLQFVVAEQQRKPRDTSSLRTCVSGGDSVPVSLQQRFQAVFGIPLQEGYALTESMIVSWNRPDGIRSGSLGQPAFGVETQVRGPGGEILGIGQVGELAVRSAANCIGYWKDPQASTAALDQGWLLTGDLGRIDAEGYLWFEGRAKTLIVRGGSNISPPEVEEALYRHPAVMEVGVIGLPDEIFGERVVACVSLRAGHAPGEEELREFARGRLADYKVPERILFLPELPKGITGKVQRRTLKEMVAGGRFAASSPADQPVGTSRRFPAAS